MVEYPESLTLKRKFGTHGVFRSSLYLVTGNSRESKSITISISTQFIIFRIIMKPKPFLIYQLHAMEVKLFETAALKSGTRQFLESKLPE
jgi:hypothetical protein